MKFVSLIATYAYLVYSVLLSLYLYKTAKRLICSSDQSPAIERDISKSVHLATLTIYFTGMILLAAYSGVLVSHFAVNKETLPFNDLQGFLKDGRYTFGILNQSAELEIFQDAKYGILNTVYRRHIARDSRSIAPSIFKGLLQACTVDKYVFLTPEYLAKAIIPRLPCKLVAVSDCIMKSNMAMAVTATSPYHGLFEYILQRLLMGGVLQKLYLGSFSQVSSWHSSWEKVGLEKVAPLLALLAIGCALAVLVLVGEMNSKWVHCFKVSWSKPCSFLFFLQQLLEMPHPGLKTCVYTPLHMIRCEELCSDIYSGPWGDISNNCYKKNCNDVCGNYCAVALGQPV